MRTSLLRFIRNLRQGDQLKANRKLITLVVCIAISAVFWLLNAYSKVYNSVVDYPVTYRNLPPNRVLVGRLPGHVSLMMRAQGFVLLYEKLRGSRDTVEIDVAGLSLFRRGETFTGLLSVKDRVDEITRQLDPEISLLKVVPDTIRFTFARKMEKEIPVKLNARLDFEKQHQLREKPSFEPASVLVTGPDYILDTLKYISTDTLVLSGLSENRKVKLPLVVPDDLPSVILASNSVEVNIMVEKFTEATVDIKVEKINVPEGFNVKMIPEKITVTYLVPFSKFEDVTARSFSARADFRNYGQKKTLPVEVIIHTEHARLVRVEPARVEYILQKK